MKLFDATLDTLSRALDTRLERQNVLAGNLANSDTPGYQPMELDFHAAMEASERAQSLASHSASSTPAREGHLSVSDAPRLAPGAPLPGMRGDASAHPSLDGNGVDLDRTLVAVSENALQYGAASKAAAKKLAILKYVASDGNA